ncbi:MAG: 2-oxoacid:acceptor oxidoreductase family protein [Anaerovoracaceae bacterium]|nr:2-oxoacid:acceptor oxidoreductase family protein [Anaerovoracaceae bacterium]
MIKKIIVSGFGGQGALTAGKIILHTAYKKGLQCTWFPSYGNEMRGGAANCNVILSDKRIASPYADHPDIVIALNELSIDKFEPPMIEGGLLFVNSSLVDDNRKYRSDITVFKAPVTEEAQKLNSERNANICMLGKMIKETNLFSIDEFEKYMCDYFASLGKDKFNEKNKEVLRAGYNL